MTMLSATGALPFFQLGHITIPIVDLDLQYFGILVATGVLIGAGVMRRYGERYALDEDDLRSMTAWVVVTGFIGAHLFDVIAYQQDELAREPIKTILYIHHGISSYGGFIGGSAGWWFYQWWKRMQTGVWADTTSVGLLVAFSIGRIGCTVVSDHVGAPTSNPLGWDYPVNEVRSRLCSDDLTKCPSWLQEAVHSGVKEMRLWNLGFTEFLYLILVNAIVLTLAFQNKKRLPAGLLAVLIGALYAPVRFFLEYLRPDQTDPRYLGLTFAQWASILVFTTAIGALVKLIKSGEPGTLAADVDKKYIAGRKNLVIAPTVAERREREEKRKRGIRRIL